MKARVDLSYGILDPAPASLNFVVPSSTVMWEKVNYLRAVSPVTDVPIIFTSSNEDILLVELVDSYWQFKSVGPGTANIIATQGENSLSKPVTVSEQPILGRTINVGSGSGTLTVDGDSLSLIPGDTIVIAGGDYEGLTVKNILNPDGEEIIRIIFDGQVNIINEGTCYFTHLRNVIIDGSTIAGTEYGFFYRGTNYTACSYGDINHIVFRNLAFENIYDAAWRLDDSIGLVEYNGTPESYLQDCKFINCYYDNSSVFSGGGDLDILNDSITGLLVDFQFLGCIIKNTSSGSPIYISGGQRILVKDCKFDNINTVNNNHNGIIMVKGSCDVVNNRLSNYQGNLIRLWPFTVADTHIETGPKTCNFVGNTIFSSRKYGAFEGQGFDDYYKEGFTTYCNIDIFNNTCGNMNQNIDPVVFTGKIYDNYDLYGGTARIFNNILINPIGDSNNVYLTYNSSAADGTETQTGDIQEFSNRCYFSLAASKVNPSSLALKLGSTAKLTATTNAATDTYTADRYGNPKINNIGAIQVDEILLPEDLDVPTTPDNSWQEESFEGAAFADSFQTNWKKSYSPIGIQNYDIEVNGVVSTTRGGYPRFGKQDPSVVSGLNVWTAYTFRAKARDWKNQESDWSSELTFATRLLDEVSEETVAEALTLTKIIGGTLVNTSGVYSATGSGVLASTGIVIPAGYAARLIMDTTVGQGILGWATSDAMTSVNDIKAGVTTSEDAGRYLSFAAGEYSDIRDTQDNTLLVSLFIDYNGNSWVERSYDGGSTWGVGGNWLIKHYHLGNRYFGDKYVVASISTDRVLTNPRIVLYPVKYNV